MTLDILIIDDKEQKIDALRQVITPLFSEDKVIVEEARTIAEAARQGWKGTDYITSEAFSPLFVYGNIKYEGTKNCNAGTNIENAMKLLKNTGVVKKRSFDALCVDYVKSSLRSQAAQYKIDDYFLLFGPNHTYEGTCGKLSRCHWLQGLSVVRVPRIRLLGRSWRGTYRLSCHVCRGL